MGDHMGQGINRLTAAALRKSKPGLYHDGLGLHLQITASKDGKRVNRSWLFRYAVNGRDRWMGLGGTHTVGLAEARELARQARLQRLQGVDPIEARRSDRAAQVAASAKAITFEQAATGYIAAHRDEWRSERHAQQWPASLAKHVHPVIGKLPVAQIDTPLLLKVFQPIWATVPQTASRLRGRVEAILDWCAVSGYRGGDNPARWQGHLEYLLAKPSKRRVEHFAALPWREVPNFMAKLRAVAGVVPRALEFTILVAARRDEARCATWAEIDLEQAIWTVPGHRMKAGNPHSVPLSARAVTILREMEAMRVGDFVFPGKLGPFDKEAPRTLLRRLGHGDITTHGFRASFRTWASEHTAFPHERGDLFEKRARLMDAWSQFCAEPIASGAVIPIRGEALHSRPG
jgi:integrase